MEAVNVRDNIRFFSEKEAKPRFIKAQGADADAAYQRLQIIRKHMRELEAEINATNTVDVAGGHALYYDEMFEKMKLLEMAEITLIHQGA